MLGLLTFLKDSIFSLKINSVSLKKRSTKQNNKNSPSTKFTEFCYSALNEKKSTATVLLDFSKAFDTIDHNILVKKLECYGIRGKSNEWLCSYLANGKQYVEINDDKSITSIITCGVPLDTLYGKRSLLSKIKTRSVI